MKRNNHFPLDIDLEESLIDEIINFSNLLRLSRLQYDSFNHDKIRFVTHIAIALKRGLIFLDKEIYDNLIVYLEQLSKDKEFIEEWEDQNQIKKDLLADIKALKK